MHGYNEVNTILNTRIIYMHLDTIHLYDNTYFNLIMKKLLHLCFGNHNNSLYTIPEALYLSKLVHFVLRTHSATNARPCRSSLFGIAAGIFVCDATWDFAWKIFNSAMKDIKLRFWIYLTFIGFQFEDQSLKSWKIVSILSYF